MLQRHGLTGRWIARTLRAYPGGHIIAHASEPPRVAGLGSAILFNLNGTIGAGIFALPALLFAGAGSLAPIAILLFAALIVPTVAVAAKLSTLFEQSGGPQLYVHHAFGELAGFQTGWLLICANVAARAANFHVMVAYLAAIFPFFGGPVATPITILVLIALFSSLAIIGTKRAIEAIWVGTILKLSPILLVCIIGLFANGVPSNVTLPQFTDVEAILLMMAYAFSGIGLSTISAGETKNPQRVIGKSIYLTLFTVAVFYAFVQFAFESIGPDVANAESPLAGSAEAVLGQTGVVLISFAAIFSIGTGQLNYFLIMPRILYGMGRRGSLPKSFAFLSERFTTPAFAISVYTVFVTILAMSGTFAILATLTVAAELFIQLAMVGALYQVWRRNDGGIAKTMGPIWILVGLAGAAFPIWLMLQVPAAAFAATAGMVIFGLGLYWLAKRNSHDGEAIRVVPES